jgi:hypothetical protein
MSESKTQKYFNVSRVILKIIEAGEALELIHLRIINNIVTFSEALHEEN